MNSGIDPYHTHYGGLSGRTTAFIAAGVLLLAMLVVAALALGLPGGRALDGPVVMITLMGLLVVGLIIILLGALLASRR